ncbi:MAG: zinc-ribbon domain-containing protein [Armatimonadota bacterium]
MGEAVLLFSIGALLAGYPVYRFIGWWIEGSITGGEVAVFLFTYIGLMGLLMMSGSAWLALMAIVLMVSGVAMVPWLGEMFNRRALRKIEEEEMYRARDVLAADPENHIVRVVLAEKLYKLGRLEEAIEHLEYAVSSSPAISRMERGKLQSWKRDLEFAQRKLVLCPMCGAENPGEARRCIQCGSPMQPLSALKEWAVEEQVVQKVLRLWLRVMAVLTVMGFAFYLLPLDVQGLVTIAALIVGAWYFLNRFGAWKQTV